MDKAQRDGETEARKDALKYCTAKRRELVWPDWDTASCALVGNVSCFYSPNEEGKQRCNGDGKIIMDAIQKIRADPTLLHDHARDQSLYNSRYYHNYSHWTGFRCELRVRQSGTASFKDYKLEGSTRSLDSLAPRPGYVR